jgi:hypothetical protein
MIYLGGVGRWCEQRDTVSLRYCAGVHSSQLAKIISRGLVRVLARSISHPLAEGKRPSERRNLQLQFEDTTDRNSGVTALHAVSRRLYYEPSRILYLTHDLHDFEI